MTYRTVRLGDYIEKVEQLSSHSLNVMDVRGVSITKKFTPTKARMTDVDISGYNVVRVGQFAFNPNTARMGEKICVALNDQRPFLVSKIYPVFQISKPNELLAEYLYQYFAREEFDRYVRFNSWGSARETFNFEDFCDVEIPLPPIEKQREYVAIYSNLLKLSTNHEKSFADLQLVLDATADKLMKSGPLRSLGSIVQPLNNRNDKNMFSDNLKGVSRNKVFIETVASTDNLDLSKYKIIQRGEFVYSGMQTGRDKCIRVALNTSVPIIVSPAYTVFKIKETVDLLPEFLMIYFKRAETDRLGWYKSDSSVRANLDWNRFCEFQVPVPSLKVQKSIVAVYHALESRKALNERLKSTIKDISPVLIKDAQDRCAGAAV